VFTTEHLPPGAGVLGAQNKGQQAEPVIPLPGDRLLPIQAFLKVKWHDGSEDIFEAIDPEVIRIHPFSISGGDGLPFANISLHMAYIAPGLDLDQPTPDGPARIEKHVTGLED
jgi:hypothetical protein